MKRLLNRVLLYTPIYIFILILLGYLYVSTLDHIFYLQFYFIYVMILITGFGIIKYSQANLVHAKSRYIRADLFEKSIILGILVVLSLVLTISHWLHISLLIIFYLLVLILIVEVITKYKTYKRILERESHDNTRTHLRP